MNTDSENFKKCLELDVCKADICVMKDIKVVDNDNFLIRHRASVVEYLQLTGDNPGFFKIIKGLITGKMELNGRQIENYQHEYAKDIKNYNFTNFFTDVD